MRINLLISLFFFFLISQPVFAQDPELPDGYDYLVKVIKPYEKKKYSSYNLYAVHMIQGVGPFVETNLFLVYFENLLPKSGDFLAFKQLEKRHVVQRFRTINNSDDEIVHRYMFESSPWGILLENKMMNNRADRRIIECAAYTGEAIILKQSLDD